jgi:hypothetical protein
MARKSRRGEESSGKSAVLSALSILLFIGISAGVVLLRAERRAQRRGETLFGRNDDRGGNGFNAPQNPQPDETQPDQPFPQPPQPKVLAPGVADTRAEGGIFANIDYREYRDDGAILVGFEVGLGAVPDTAVVTYLRPIWLTADGEQFGTAYGRTKNPIETVKARDGYAIGGVRMKGGGAIEGICFTFMRRGERHLITDDFYVSDWYGEPTRKLPENDLRRGEGGFVIGLHGKRFEDKGGTEFHDSGCIGTLGFTTWVRE